MTSTEKSIDDTAAPDPVTPPAVPIAKRPIDDSWTIDDTSPIAIADEPAPAVTGELTHV